MKRAEWKERVASRMPPSAFLTAGFKPCRYPDDPPAWPGCEEVKRHAAKAARARTDEARAKAEERLREALGELDGDAIRLWASAVMIDRRWNGATGCGGYWAKASEICNRAARSLL